MDAELRPGELHVRITWAYHRLTIWGTCAGRSLKSDSDLLSENECDASESEGPVNLRLFRKCTPRVLAHRLTNVKSATRGSFQEKT